MRIMCDNNNNASATKPPRGPRNKLRKAPKSGRAVSLGTPLPPKLSLGTTESDRASLPAPGLSSPDLSDSKWEDFVRQSSCPQFMTKSPRLEHIENIMSPTSALPSPASPASPPAASAEEQQQQQAEEEKREQEIVPEFAHLSITAAAAGDDSLQPPTRNPRRQSLDGATQTLPMRSLSSSSTSTTASSGSAASRKFRWYPKTPVFRVGQFDNEQQQQEQQQVGASHIEAAKTPPIPAVPRRSATRLSAAETLAEEYQSLLQSRTGARPRMEYDKGVVHVESAPLDMSIARQESIEAIRSAIARRLPAQPRRPMVATPPLSAAAWLLGGDAPESSDGALVGFKEDAIFFKPAFTPEGALTPIPEDEGYDRSLTGIDDNLSLQICVDMLENELQSVLARRDSGYEGLVGPDKDDVKATWALQIWLMIEAYDRLRILLARDTNLSPHEAEALEAIFDTWLEALGRVHDRVSVENTI